MKFLFILFITLFFNIDNGISKTSEIESNKNKIEKLSKKIDDLEKSLEVERNINEKTFNSISIQLSTSSNSLTLFGVLFSVIGILIGFYVTYIERKIVQMKEQTLELLNQSLKVKNEVVELNNLIQNDISNLYKKIKREETNHMLDRLVKVPKDVSNLIQELLSRDLERADFEKLKMGYQKLLPTELIYKTKYNMLFFQHFSDLALKDEITRESFIGYIPSGIESSFENDILKSTGDLFQHFFDEGLSNNADQIRLFFNSLCISKFKNFNEVYELVFKKLLFKEARFILAELVGYDAENEPFHINYGTLLIETYDGTSLKINEIAILRQLKDIISKKSS